jgi:Pectate lyase superfamily protein
MFERTNFMIKRTITSAIFIASIALCQTLPNAVPMPTPEIQYVDSTGVPLAGAYLCTYAAGTSTPLATYTDSTAATPNTNPVVLDSAGRASVWVGPSLYKFVLRTGGSGNSCSTGAVVWTQDNVADTTLYFTNYVKTIGTSTSITYTIPLTGGVSRTVSNRLSDFVSVKDFGAVCDGTTDDHAAIQAAINALSSGGTVNFPNGTCSVGTVGITVPVVTILGTGIILQGQGYSSTLKYTGSGTAVTIGVQGSFTYRSGVRQMGINITSAGINAHAMDVITCLYCFADRAYIYSGYGSTSNQTGLWLGGGIRSSLFGAYFQWTDTEIAGYFKYGLYMTGQIAWGYNACQFIGGAIIGQSVAGTVGFYINQGNENSVFNMDVENFGTGYEIHAYDNVFFGARAEGNTIDILFAAASGDCCAVATSTTGGTYNRAYGSFFSDGITDNSGGSTEWHGTLNGGNVETHLKNNLYVDTTLNITGNTAIKWTGAAGGSEGLFWYNGGGSPVADIYQNGTVTHFNNNNTDWLLMDATNGLVINKGIYRNSNGLQHISIPANQVCTTGAAIGSACGFTITWNTVWADTNYTISCTIDNVVSGSPYLQILTKTTTTTTGQIVAGTAAAANAGYDCIAIHW